MHTDIYLNSIFREVQLYPFFLFFFIFYVSCQHRMQLRLLLLRRRIITSSLLIKNVTLSQCNNCTIVFPFFYFIFWIYHASFDENGNPIKTGHHYPSEHNKNLLLHPWWWWRRRSTTTTVVLVVGGKRRIWIFYCVESSPLFDIRVGNVLFLHLAGDSIDEVARTEWFWYCSRISRNEYDNRWNFEATTTMTPTTVQKKSYSKISSTTKIIITSSSSRKRQLSKTTTNVTTTLWIALSNISYPRRGRPVEISTREAKAMIAAVTTAGEEEVGTSTVLAESCRTQFYLGADRYVYDILHIV